MFGLVRGCRVVSTQERMKSWMSYVLPVLDCEGYGIDAFEIRIEGIIRNDVGEKDFLEKLKGF